MHLAVNVVSTGSILVPKILLFNRADMQLKAVVNPLILISLLRRSYLSEFLYIVVKITQINTKVLFIVNIWNDKQQILLIKTIHIYVYIGYLLIPLSLYEIVSLHVWVNIGM